MFRLMISFKREDFHNDVWSKPNEYLLSDANEVCKVITSLSHLNPIITLCHVSVMSADDVLKDFELKDI